MDVRFFDCITAAGVGSGALFQALSEGRDCSEIVPPNFWPGLPADMTGGRICRMPVNGSSARERILTATQMLARKLPTLEGRCGLVFASTKGMIEDVIWKMNSETSRASTDPVSGLLPDLSEIIGPRQPWALRTVLSNACSSNHVALEFINDLFLSDQLDTAVLVADDVVGPFVYQGFSSLKVSTKNLSRPFDGLRDGLQLGEAVGLFVLSRQTTGGIRILSVKSDTEGTSITRPSVNGVGLARVIREVIPHGKPDLVIAHGTGTRFNDQAEDQALFDCFGETSLPVICTKWSIGHTLGASGAVDLVAACEVLKRQQLFAIRNTTSRDPSFKMNYLLEKDLAGTRQADPKPQKIQRIMTTSLGFGGVHAALLLEGPTL